MKAKRLRIIFLCAGLLAFFTACNCPYPEGISQEQFRQMLLNGEVEHLAYDETAQQLKLEVNPALPYHHHHFIVKLPEGLPADVLLQDIRYIIEHLPREQQISLELISAAGP